jgi:hypothetical protein
MKSLFLASASLIAAFSLVAADKDDVAAAAKKLAAADNYSWTTTIEAAQFAPGPSHGKIQKDGLTWMDFSMRDTSGEAYLKGAKGAVKTDEGWKSLEEAAAADSGDGGFNFQRFLVMRLRSFKAPAAQAGELATQTKSLAKADGAYAGDLTEEGAKNALSFGGRRGGQAPDVSNAKGSVKFWIKDGAITKYQIHVSGTVSFNGNDRDVDRTTTVEIKDVGTTKVTLPDAVKSKLS